MNRRMLLVAVALLAVCASLADGAIRIVRTGTTYSTVQLAVNAAIDGDTIELDSGTYYQSTAWATVNKNNLTIRGVGATMPVLDAGGSSLAGKAIFIITGTNTTVDFLEFKNCSCTSKNGAGIRQEGANLTVRNSYFHDNEDGILANAVVGSSILIEYSEFNHNGYGDGQSHNMYINGVDSFTLRHCWSHRANDGHEVKSRAKVNYILYNRLTNEDGTGSMETDIPNGGTTYFIGNLVHQGVNGSNGTSLTYGAEGVTNPTSDLYVINNTFVNNRSATSIAINNYATTYAQVQNNIIQGYATTYLGNCTLTTNWVTTNAYLANLSTYDYHLTASSTGAINMGSDPGSANGFSLWPTNQYVQPCATETRPVNGTIDIGCYEYGAVGNQAPQVDAGSNQAITWPTNSVNLDGTVTDDGLPNPPASVSTAWSKVSGPGTVVFGNVYAVDTTATFSQAGVYVLQLLADDSALQSSDTVTITVNAAATDDVATAETTIYGTKTGSYLDTQSSNNVYEALTEVMNGTSYSWLEHRWTFSVTGGSSVTFYVEAYRPSNSDGDNFTFAYSTNGSTWTNMVTVSKSSDDNQYQTYALPAGTSGTVYVRVVDTNRKRGKTSLDTIYVDHMFFRSQP